MEIKQVNQTNIMIIEDKKLWRQVKTGHADKNKKTNFKKSSDRSWRKMSWQKYTGTVHKDGQK